MKKLRAFLVGVISICLILIVGFACDEDDAGVNTEYSVSINFNYQNACKTVGELNQTVSKSKPFTSVEIIPNLGYEFVYYEVDGIKYLSNPIQLVTCTKDTVINVVLDYAVKELPIINIQTSADISSNSEYVEMSFSMSNCDEPLKNVAGDIRLSEKLTRKKSYSLEFSDKQSLFGLDKSTSWVLLADYLDPSSIKTYSALSLGNQTEGLSFTPTPNKVNVYVNNEYTGLYTLCEQVEVNKGRINIEMQTYEKGFISSSLTSLSEYNFLVCMNRGVENDKNAIEGQTYFYIEKYDIYFELKYPQKSQFKTEKQFNEFFGQLVAYMEKSLDVCTNGNFEDIKKILNVNSLIDFYIIDAIMLERDHVNKSFNMYYCASSKIQDEVGKLSFGAIWDYDFSIYKKWTGKPCDVESFYDVNVNEIAYSNRFFRTIQRVPELKNLLKERYSSTFNEKFQNFIDGLDVFVYSIRESISLNNMKWYSGYDYDISKANIEFVQKYLIERKKYLDSIWKV